MNGPRYRTLDGDEIELPLAMDRWVLVPRTLARFDPELAWTLDYDDAPEPERRRPAARLHRRRAPGAGRALERARRARAEPRAVRGHRTHRPRRSIRHRASLPRRSRRSPRDLHARGGFRVAASRAFARAASAALAALAIGYVVAVAAWLWSLRHQISGPDVSTGLLLVGAAMLLAWLAGVAGAVPGVRSLASPRWRDPGRSRAQRPPPPPRAPARDPAPRARPSARRLRRARRHPLSPPPT